MGMQYDYYVGLAWNGAEMTRTLYCTGQLVSFPGGLVLGSAEVKVPSANIESDLVIQRTRKIKDMLSLMIVTELEQGSTVDDDDEEQTG